jgi:Flp pilus assembly protein TadG
MLRTRLGIVGCTRGSAAVEAAFILPAFLMLLFGIIKVSMLLWTLGSLHYAAEAAARYASVNCASSCTPDPATYALDSYYGQSLGGTNPFSYSAATGCGNTVTASYTYSLNIPLVGSYSVPLTTAACFP